MNLIFVANAEHLDRSCAPSFPASEPPAGVVSPYMRSMDPSPPAHYEPVDAVATGGGFEEAPRVRRLPKNLHCTVAHRFFYSHVFQASFNKSSQKNRTPEAPQQALNEPAVARARRCGQWAPRRSTSASRRTAGTPATPGGPSRAPAPVNRGGERASPGGPQPARRLECWR